LGYGEKSMVVKEKEPKYRATRKKVEGRMTRKETSPTTASKKFKKKKRGRKGTLA
jgi:hypothetical protein